ncbi:MAG: neutral/alkaline non-lysosomal ceramidase N-terminal domain-containing protein [Planctomycetaceae bacterium]|nr:neutral/alkaline non-lysosomal ceramidase N-terminal domain-containing protein [Planctomycetaceae bacterium]
MKHFNNTSFVCSLFCVIAIVLQSSVVTAEFRAGAAKQDITPAMGVSLDGSISKPGPSKSVHDLLHARALVLEDGSTRVAIVICDLCMMGQDVVDDAKKLIHQQTEIPISNILIAATHTHAAPRAIHIGTEPIDDEYHRLLSVYIAKAVSKANSHLTPARIGFTSFEKTGLIACRRSLCKPGSVGPNVFGETGEQVKSVAGKSSAVIGPAGPTDPQFSVLSVQTLDGEPICVLGNFSVHYCGGYQRGAVSADYFGYFSEAIESNLHQKRKSSTSPEVIGILSNGTSGNTGAFQRSAGQKFAAFEGMLFYGRMLADNALQATQQTAYSTSPLCK